MDKIAIYCRVSSQFQATDRQKIELMELAKARNINVHKDYIYEDIISGYTIGEERPEYAKMLDAVDAGNITEIWCHELTRMARNSIELLSEIQKLRDKGVKLYFFKQDLTVDPNKKSDIGQQILLNVLSVCAEYEIQLFTERSLSGKIRKIADGGGVTSDSNAYGYMIDKEGKMVKKEDEAAIVKRIFTMYADGASTIQICDMLNAEGVPTSYTTRLAQSEMRRQKKGLPPKEYKNFITTDEFKWRPNVISKILNKDLYCGHRHVTFHEPIPDKEKKKEMLKRGETPKVIYTHDVQIESLRIIDDDLFLRVQQRLLKAPYNKNNTTKHDNLLTHKLRCGECGSNFSVGKGTVSSDKDNLSGERTYRCYGRINRSDKPSICTQGAEVRQWRLDGLVLMLSILQFAKSSIQNDTQNKVNEKQNKLSEVEKLITGKQKEIDNSNVQYKMKLKRLVSINDETAEELIMEAKEEHTKGIKLLAKELEKYQKEAYELRSTIGVLKSMRKHANLYQRVDDIWNNKTLIKSMVDEFIETVTLYRIDKSYHLVVVDYVNGNEFWGTIKSARYRNNEMFYDEIVCHHGVEFHTWVIINNEKCFAYRPESRTIVYNGKSKIYSDLEAGEYDYASFTKVLADTQQLGSYPLYDFDNGADVPIPDIQEPERW